MIKPFSNDVIALNSDSDLIMPVNKVVLNFAVVNNIGIAIYTLLAFVGIFRGRGSPFIDLLYLSV